MEPSQLNWIANFIWGIADDVLRDLYVRGKYRDVILPMTVLRRLDAVLEYGTDGQFRKVDAAATLDEAERRVRTIRVKFQGRRMHAEVLKYCRTELMQDNYFHAVFEAAKGLAQRIREMTGVQADGANLIDRVFSIDQPLLALNTLRTETEKSEHKGFAALLKGCFAAVRNPLAHEPKILWEGEDDAADYLSLISLLHRKLDQCVPTGLTADS